MDEFIVQLLAQLDTSKVIKDYNVLKQQLEKQINIKVNLDTSVQKDISKLAEQLQTALSKASNGKLNIDTSQITNALGQVTKNAQQTGQQIGNSIRQSIDQSVKKAGNSLKSFSDLTNFSNLNKSIKPLTIDTSELKNYQDILNRIKNSYAEFGQVKITNESFNNGILEKFKVNIEQVNGDLKETKSFMMSLNEDKSAFVFNGFINGSESIVQHLDKSKNAINQTADAINALKLKTQSDKIQLKIETGDYESKVESLITKTQQWTDQNGVARLSTTDLSTALHELTAASETYANNPTEATQKRLIESSEKFDAEYKKITNSVRKMNAELAKDSAVSSLHNQVSNFMSKNGKTVKYFGTELKDIFHQTVQGAELSNQELTKLKQKFIDVQNAARNSGKLGKTFFQTLREGMSSFSYWTSSTFLVMKAIQSIKSGISTVKELDTALVDLKKTTTMTASELEKFYYDSNETAKQMGVTTKEILV